jgi:hypothetical protein
MSADEKAVRAIETPTSLTYTYSPGRAATRFLRAIEQKKLMGQRCPSCNKVYIPPRGACARCGVPTEEQVLLGDKGTIVSFCIVRVPSENISLELPYVAASILLDGADIPFQALVAEVKPETVRMGTRVQAVWVDDAELKPSFTNIKWFRPTGEPDVPFERFKEHL